MSEWKKEFQYLLDRKILSREELAYLFGQIKSIINSENKELKAENERFKELMKGATLDYGYANGWSGEEPVLVKECKEKGHTPRDTGTGRMFDNIVWCDLCHYQYKYDSS